MDEGFSPDRETARARDDADPLTALRDRFHVPEGERYMDGNSLGLLSTDAERTIDRVVDEWRERGIRGWEAADEPWFTYAEHLGDRVAPLVGAREEEVVVANSTTVNIHTLIGTFLDAHDGSPTVLVNRLDFPTDHYAIRSQLRARGHDPEEHLVLVESEDGRTIPMDAVETALEHHDVGIVFMPSVLYRSGQLFDVERLTDAAHEHGALAGFDLAHSVGVVPHDLHDAGVDFAVWCSYKYLNAGPGAIAGLYVHEDHFGTEPALAGWWGHEKATQFELREHFTPEPSAGGWQIGTVPVLSAAPLEGSLDLIADAATLADRSVPDDAAPGRVGIEALRERSVALTEYLIDLVDERLTECSVGTPRAPARRGGHVAIEHPEGYRVSEALRDRGVVVDFRPPNVVRVCPSPYYTTHEDVWAVVETIREVVATGAYEEYDRRDGGVT